MSDQRDYLTDPRRGEKPPAPIRPEGRRSFLWLMGFFLTLFTIAMVWWTVHIYQLWQNQQGDGRNPQTYGFDLTNFTGDRSVLVGSGEARDQIPAIQNPTMVQAAKTGEAAKGWSRVVTTDDLVIGIVIGGEARAYPLRYLQWHEIVNDTVGPEQTPIAVTYNKLCDSAVVFDRRAIGAPAPLTFGHSGLLYNSNLLMYDEQATDEAQSLWSQLGFKAMSGPLAGTELTVLPMYFGRWDAWLEQHPQTLVWGGESRFKSRYNKRVLLPGYFERGELKFPVKPLPPGGSPLKLMDRVMAIGGRSGWMVWPVESIAIEDGQFVFPRGASATFTLTPDGVKGSAMGGNATVRACWFAWYAFHGADEFVAPADTPGKPGG